MYREKYNRAKGYGKANGVEGFDGYISCLEERQKLELEILEQVNIDKIIIDTPFENWERTHNKIRELIKALDA